MILSSLHFPPILYFAYLVQSKNEEIKIDIHENFIKQTYRNRYSILGPNGVQNLIVPMKKSPNNCPINLIEIDYSENWQKQHFRSLKTAYGNSPYFEFYEDVFQNLIVNHHEKYLIDYNFKTLNKVLGLLKTSLEISFTQKFEPYQTQDLRLEISPKKALKSNINFQNYIQVFSDKTDFVPNLSILDLIFNLGNQSKNYLSDLKIK
jgi:hypothetical protein